MTKNSNLKIYAPNVYLFAFHIREGIDTNFQPFLIDRDWVEQQCKNVLKNFPNLKNESELKLRQDTPNSKDFNLLAEGKPYRLFKSKPNPQTGKPDQRLLIYPQVIGDSYALSFDSHIYQLEGQDFLAIEDLNELNPNNCLSFKTNLGKTILLTAFIPENQENNLEEIGKQCLQFLLNLSPEENLPEFYRQGKLFDSPILEYGNPIITHPYGHFLVLFFTQEESSENFKKIYWKLPHLFLYYHKITKTFADSRRDYKKADQKFSEIEQLIKQLIEKNQHLPDRSLSVAETKQFKSKLKLLLNEAVQYSRLMRNLEFCQNTIAINTRNYQVKVEQLQTSAETELSFFASFTQQECSTLKAQIAADLNYLKQGTIILDQAIATIRGLIEIDEVERDRALQTTIATLGVGVATGSIFATSYTLRSKDNPLQIPVISQLTLTKSLHPVTKCFSYSLIVGLLAGLSVLAIINLKERLLVKKHL